MDTYTQISPIKNKKKISFLKLLDVKKMQHCLELGLMVDVDVQGTSEITVICRAGSRGHGQRDT